MRPVMGEFIVGIDPGTLCGWAVIDDSTGARVASGVWDLSTRRHEGGGMRFVRARRRLLDVVDTYRPVAVAYEEVARHRGTAAAHVYGGLVGVMTALCEERETPYMGIPVGTVKKLATGKGNANKAAMVAAAARRWALADAVDDNEADALWVAETWRRTA